MNTITDEQAEALRQLRPRLRPVVDEVKEIAQTLARACPHNPETPEVCCMCALYRAFADADNAIHYTPDDLDTALLNGPHPMAKHRT